MRLVGADSLLSKLNEAYKKADAKYHRLAFNAFGAALVRCYKMLSERLRNSRQPEEVKWVSVEDRLPSDGDSRFYMCLVENHLEDPPMCCQYEEGHGFGFWNDIYDPVTLCFVDSEFQTIEEPIMTVDGSNRYGLVTSFLSKFYKSGIGQDEREPLHTITTSAGHFGEVRAFLIKYYGEGTGQDIEKPLDTVTAKDRFGLVTINGADYKIIDIGLRMLEPKELYGCQGFPDDYIIDHDYTGKTYPRSEQVRRCGNAVCPPIPAALVRANLPELCVAKRTPNMRIESEQTGQLRFA